MGLGAFPSVSLGAARLAAAAARETLAAGNDPLAARDAARERARLEAAHTITFTAAAEKYLATHGETWARKQRLEWTNSLKAHVLPVLGSLAVRDIDTPQVLEVLEPLWAIKRVTAGRIRRRIEAVLDWARAGGSAKTRIRRVGRGI